MSLIGSDNNWFDKGLCRSHDTEMFFAETGEVLKTKKAKTICSGCPVRIECLTYAIQNREAFGVWGGMTTKQRNKLSRNIGPGISIEKVKAFVNASKVQD